MQRAQRSSQGPSVHSRDTLLILDQAVRLSRRPTAEFLRVTPMGEPLSRESSPTGPYKVENPLGQGGMGEVHSAVDRNTGRHVALKTAPISRGYHEDTSKFLSREIKALSRVSHENVVAFIDSGVRSDDETPFLVMEHLDGQTISSLIDEYGQLPWDLVRPIILQLCDALQAVHETNMVHADVKPDNIFLAEEPGATRVKLLDFGLVRFMDDEHGDPERANEGMTLGTPEYMAPEQIRAGTCESFGPSADLYAVGLVMYEMLTGSITFGGHRLAVEVMHSILNENPLPPSTIVPTISAEVDALIMCALEKDPKKRFNSAQQMAEVISCY